MKNLRFALLPLLALLLSCDGGEPAPKNVLFIAIDTLRADRMSLYGYDKPTSPHIDAFAATATTFDRAHSPSSWTRASFASYFTGLTPHAHGCENRDGQLAESHLTLAERFREGGYATASIYANANIAPEFGFDQGFDLYDHPPTNAGYPRDWQVTDAAGMNERTLKWLRDERPADEPWFLFLLYMDPHDPYMPHDEHVFGPPVTNVHNGSRRVLRAIDNGERITGLDQSKAVIQGLYDGEIAYVDRHIGALLDELDALGLADDTVVILTADHGEGLWDHDEYRSHGEQVYQGQIHVPLVLRWPGRTEAGARVATPVNVLDVFGTLTTGLSLPGDGATQSGSLFAPSGAPLYIEELVGRKDMRSVIDWPWKLILNRGGLVELYHLERDPRETTSLVDEEPDVAARLTDIATARRLEGEAIRGGVKIEGDGPVMDESTKRELEALGY